MQSETMRGNLVTGYLREEKTQSHRAHLPVFLRSADKENVSPGCCVRRKAVLGMKQVQSAGHLIVIVSYRQ